MQTENILRRSLSLSLTKTVFIAIGCLSWGAFVVAAEENGLPHLWLPEAENPPPLYQQEAEALQEIFPETSLQKADRISPETVKSLEERGMLWLTAPRLADDTQEALLEWVREGGHLILAPGAMSQTMDGKQAKALTKALAPSLEKWPPVENPERLFGERQVEVRWYSERDPDAAPWEIPDPAATALVDGPARSVEGGAGDVDPSGRARNVVSAEYADGRPAAVDFALGSGRVRILGFFPGSAEEPETLIRLMADF